MLLALLFATAWPRLTLAAVGDVMLGRWVGRHIDRDGPGAVLKAVRPELGKADITYGNLECALTQRPFAHPKQILLRADPKSVVALKGLSVLSLVNNHAGDAGPEGLADSERAVRQIGALPLLDGQAVYQRINGLKVAWVGLSDLPGYPLVGGFERQLAAARAKCDLLFVAIHWGVEGLTSASQRQKQLATKLANLGVDAVLGCHPHVLEPTQWLSGPHGHRCLVAYSLGNFVFDARPGLERKTKILFLSCGKKGVERVWTRSCTIVNGFPKPG